MQSSSSTSDAIRQDDEVILVSNNERDQYPLRAIIKHLCNSFTKGLFCPSNSIATDDESHLSHGDDESSATIPTAVNNGLDHQSLSNLADEGMFLATPPPIDSYRSSGTLKRVLLFIWLPCTCVTAVFFHVEIDVLKDKVDHQVQSSTLIFAQMIAILLWAMFTYGLEDLSRKERKESAESDERRCVTSIAETEDQQSSTFPSQFAHDFTVLSDHGDLVECHLSNSNGDNINIDLGDARSNLPDVSSWKYRPVFIQPVGDTHCPGLNEKESMPIGVPFDFETNLFKGKIMIRLRCGNCDDDEKRDAFMKASKLKIQLQIVIQGMFKKAIKMNNVWFGDIYDKKLKLTPPPRIASIMHTLFSKLAPGIILDFFSDRPKVLALLGSCCHSVSVDEFGSEPDMTALELPENTFMSSNLESSKLRKKSLGDIRKASQYTYRTDKVYTFNNIDEVVDIANFRLRLPFASIDIAKIIGNQPISLRALTNAEDSQESLFFFRVWHERILKTT